MNGQCIICMNSAELTVEHVIPESVGGALTIDTVCRDCNSRLAREIDEPFSKSDYVSLYRYVVGIPGKRGDIPNPFSRGGTLPDGTKVVLDQHLVPQVVPSSTRKALPDVGTKIEMNYDAKKQSEGEAAARKAVERVLRGYHSDWQETQIREECERLLQQTLATSVKQSSQNPIGFHFCFDLAVFEREFLKVAYETASYHFGYPYVNNSKLAAALRSNLFKQTPCGRVEFYAQDNYHDVVSAANWNYVILCEQMAYIRIAGVCGGILFEEYGGTFSVPAEHSVVVQFDPGTAYEEEKEGDETNA